MRSHDIDLILATMGATHRKLPSIRLGDFVMTNASCSMYQDAWN